MFINESHNSLVSRSWDFRIYSPKHRSCDKITGVASSAQSLLCLEEKALDCSELQASLATVVLVSQIKITLWLNISSASLTKEDNLISF